MIQLNEKQLKTLKLFAYYCESYGAKEVYQSQYVDNCEIDYLDDNWYSENNQLIEGYEAINNLIDELITEYELFAAGDDRDCDNSAILNFEIDCIKRNIRVIVSEKIMKENQKWNEKKLDDETFDDFFNYMKENNFEEGVVRFNGYAGEGEIHDKIEFDGTLSEDLDDDVLNFLYNWLGNFYLGWEENEGSYGYFTFYNDKKITLELNEYEEDYDSLGEIFKAEF
jgi:hypothetical protein